MARYIVSRLRGHASGTGSDVNPWPDLSTALAAVAGGDEVEVEDGDYRESTGGVGYLNLSRTLSPTVTVRGRSGVRSAVSVGGSTHASISVLNGGSLTGGYRFEDITFRAQGPGAGAALRLNAGGPYEFVNCDIVIPGTAGTKYGIQSVPSGTQVLTGMLLENCDVLNPLNLTGSLGVDIDATTVGAQNNNFTIRGSRVNAGIPVTLRGITSNFLLESSQFIAIGTYGGRIAEENPPSLGTATGAVRSCVFDCSAGTGHGLRVGSGASGVIVELCPLIVGGDYGLVVKECVSPVVRYNYCMGGRVHATNCSALYIKGAVTNGSFVANTLYGNRGTVGVLRVGVGDAAGIVSAASITGHKIIADGVEALLWPTGSDNNNCVSDGHTYMLRGAATLGDLRAAVNMANKAALLAAWGGYGVANNDANSVVETAPASSIARPSGWSW